MKTILAATDFSINGNHAVEYAACLAEELKSRLIVCHVNETLNEAPQVNQNETEREMIKEISDNLNIIEKEVKQKHINLRVECKTLQGANSSLTIHNYSLSCQADLIVVGCTGNNYLERKLIGSTSSKLLDYASVPVLCVPDTSNYNPIKKIAFATDMKEDNLGAAINIITFAKHFNAEILFLFIDQKDEMHSDEKISSLTSKIREKVRYPKISGYIIHDNKIRKGINDFQKKYHADLLAMMKRESGESKQIHTRSNSVYISEHITFPLLVLKPGVVSVI